eukprot:3039882-Pyramimonas_sp.AAC.1
MIIGRHSEPSVHSASISEFAAVFYHEKAKVTHSASANPSDIALAAITKVDLQAHSVLRGR